MSDQITLKISQEQAREMPMVDVAFQILKVSNTPYYYRDLMMEVAKIKGMTSDEISAVIAQLYTEINIDGRFACVGTNLWGLKRWYPLDKSEGAVGSVKRPKIINDDLDDDLDDEEIFDDEDIEEEEDFVEEEDEYFDEDDVKDEDKELDSDELPEDEEEDEDDDLELDEEEEDEEY